MAGKPPGEADIQIGQHLRRLRKNAGMTLQQLGDLFGVSAAQTQKFETGRNRLSYERAQIVCAHLGVPIDQLYAGVAPAEASGFHETAQPGYLPNDPWAKLAEAVIHLGRELDDPARRHLAEACRTIGRQLAD